MALWHACRGPGRIKLVKSQQQQSTQEVLALREANLTPEEIAAFIASIWPDDRLKDPIPPYETEAP